MNKKCLFLIFISLMLVSILSACGGSDGITKENEATPVETIVPENNEPVTIKFHAPGFTDEEMQPVLDRFSEQNEGMKVEYIPLTESTADEQMKKIDLLAASGEDLDVFILADGRSYAQRISVDLLEPLDNLMAEELLDYNEVYKTDTMIDGKYYGLPITYSQWLVILNKEALDEANLPVPKDWTWDEYLEYSKALTKGSGANSRYGSFFYTWPDYAFLSIWNQPEASDIILGSSVMNIDDPNIRKSLEIRHQAELIDKSVFPYTNMISQKTSYANAYFAKQAAMVPIASFFINTVGGNDKFEASFETVFAPWPKNHKDDPAYTVAANNYLVMASTSKHKKEAYKFMRFFTTEGYQMMNKGLSSYRSEDTSNVLDSIIQKANYPELVNKESLEYVLDVSVPVVKDIPPPFIEEVYSAFQDEMELMLLDKQDIDTTINKAKEKIQNILNANK